MVKKLLSILVTGVICITTSCAGGKAPVAKQSKPSSDERMIKELRALGYIDEPTPEEKKRIEQELKNLGYMDTQTEDEKKTEQELRNLGYLK